MRYCRHHLIPIKNVLAEDRQSTSHRASRAHVFIAAVQMFIAVHCGVGCSTKPIEKAAESQPVAREEKVVKKLTQGEPARGMRLVEAISRICAPKGLVPVWVLVNEEGKTVASIGDTPEGWVWQGEDSDGPRGNWKGDGSDPIRAVATWIAPYRVLDGDKVNGIMLKCDPEMKDKLFLIRTDWGAYDNK